MKSVWFIIALSVFSIACSSTISTIDYEAEKQAVRAVWDATVSGVLSGDYDAWAAPFSEDVEIVSPRVARRLVGVSSVESVFRRAIESGAFQEVKTTRFDAHVSSSAEMAWATLESEIVLGVDTLRTWYTLVFEKQDGEWKMVLGNDVEIE